MKNKVVAWVMALVLAVGLMQYPLCIQAASGCMEEISQELEELGLEEGSYAPAVPAVGEEGSENAPVYGAGPVFENAVTEGDWTYQISDGKAGIVHYDGTDTEVSVPSTLGGYPVVFLGELTFAGEYVEIPGLGMGFYKGNTVVAHLNIPAIVTEINKWLFGYLEALESIEIDADNKMYTSKDGVLFSKDMSTICAYPKSKRDKVYIVPDTVTEIGDSCFGSNDYLEFLDLNHVKTFGYRSVSNCDSLRQLDVGDTCERIERDLVGGCEKLEEIIIPDTVKLLLGLYTNCPSLSRLSVQEGSQYFCSIENVIFNKEKTQLVCYAPNRAGREYTVPDTVDFIYSGAFSECKNLEEITFPENTEKIWSEALAYSSIKKVVIKNPECYIFEGADTICKNAVIYGYKPSSAYEYAMDYGRIFVDLKTGSSETTKITFESMLESVPIGFSGEPTYQTTDVIHEADTSRSEYTKLKQFTDQLVSGCTTDYQKAEKISQWVHGHIAYKFGRIAGNTIESVYALFYSDAPEGNCMAYTRLASYMLYLAGIPSLEVINEEHEWCMAYLGDKWLIIDATNNIITDDYTDSLYASPKFMSFSEDGNIYAVRNNSGVYLTGVNYGQIGAASATEVIVPDYVTRIDSDVFRRCTSSVSVTCRIELEREIKKTLSCIKKEGNMLVAKKYHDYSNWSYVGDTSEMERICSHCKDRETKQGFVFTPSWYGKDSYQGVAGEELSLDNKCSSTAKIQYQSSDENIAVVDSEGTVTLKSPGTVQILLSVNETNIYAASEHTITVKVIAISQNMYESMLGLVPAGVLGEPTYQTSAVIHEPNTSRREYTTLKQFTEELTAGCTTDYEKAEKISGWVHGHITYQPGITAGNTMDSVYRLFSGSAPKGDCLAYTKLAAYMLYLAGIPTIAVSGGEQEWCMAYIGEEWLILDAMNHVITKDYTSKPYVLPKSISFSENGNIYTIKNGNDVYLTGINYGKAADAGRVVIPDYVNKVDPAVFQGCSSNLNVIGSSKLKFELRNYLFCMEITGDTLSAWKEHAYSDWAYIGDTYEMERVCKQCKDRKTKKAYAYTPSWHGKKSYTGIVGEHVMLENGCNSDGKISYKSSNPKVAAISPDGKVALKGAGTAKITLSVKESRPYAASECVVTVKAIDLGKPKITKFQAVGMGKDKASVHVTISWKKAKNADGYYVCYGSAGDGSAYGMKAVEEDGKATKTVSFAVPAFKDASNKFWVEAYQEKEDLTNKSESRYYTQASVSLSKKSYTYNGKAKLPSVTVKAGNKKLVKNRDYTVSYSGNKNVGKAKVSIILKGKYGGKLSASFTICPPKATLSSVKKASAGKMVVKWKKAAQASGYQIQYAQNRGFTKGRETHSISGAKTASQKISGLKKGKTYYVRIRVYKAVSGQKYYSGWSKGKRVKV